MRFAAEKTLIIISVIFLTLLTTAAQDLTRELNLGENGSIEIINKYGRIAAKAEPPVGDKPAKSRLTAMSPKGISDSEIKKVLEGGPTMVIVTPSDTRKRIDLIVTLPERSNIRLETLAGAIEVVGNFASIEAKTETGTVLTDIPAEELTYQFLWTESRPRYLADFDIAQVKEKKAGMFEIKGRRTGEVKSKKEKGKKEENSSEFQDPDPKAADPKAKAEISKAVSLNFTTARGIILLNVPANEVMSDLRERPLTEAAKAIVRSGDSLLMEAIRRASPKYFGDYALTLPPLRREPTFSAKSSQTDNPNAATKTASATPQSPLAKQTTYTARLTSEAHPPWVRVPIATLDRPQPTPESGSSRPRRDR